MKSLPVSRNTPMVLKERGYTRGRFSRIADITEELEARASISLRRHVDDDAWTGYVVWAGSWLGEACDEDERQARGVVVVEVIIGNGW